MNKVQKGKGFSTGWCKGHVTLVIIWQNRSHFMKQKASQCFIPFRLLSEDFFPRICESYLTFTPMESTCSSSTLRSLSKVHKFWRMVNFFLSLHQLLSIWKESFSLLAVIDQYFFQILQIQTLVKHNFSLDIIDSAMTLFLTI